MLDIHTHILPKVDDGSQSMQQSLKMLRWEAKQGVDRIVLTPHYYANREAPYDFVKRREKSMIRLAEATAEKKGIPRWFPGAEVAFFSGMSRVEEIETLCIGNSRAMLIEMPFGRWSQGAMAELEYLLRNRGIQPIIAHVERYIQFQPWGTIRQLCRSGIWIQANASFFCRWQTSWLAMRMLKKRRIHFIGSDCHDLKARKPNMGKALLRIEKKLGKRTMAYLEHMERKLLEGE